jgi:hypothetical protein
LPEVDELDVAILQDLLHRQGLMHLEVRKHGTRLFIESQFGEDRIQHARLTAQSRTRWALAFPDHRGRMQLTPYLDTLEALVELMTSQFAWMLEPLS